MQTIVGCTALTTFGWSDWLRWGMPLLATMAVGAVAAWIAYQQARIAKAKVKLDLFDRRWKFYAAVLEFLKSPMNNEPESKSVMAFNAESVQGDFLFGPDIEAYISTIWRHYKLLWQLNIRGAQHPLDEDERKQQLQTSMWFVKQVQSEAAKVFRPYLSFAEWT